MPVAPTYPGVYIQEIPSGVRTITGVATSITAFIGQALWGPVDTPTIINSYADYERQFGGLVEYSTMSYAVRQFYQNGGSQAIIVRVVGTGAKESDIALGSLNLEAANPGAWGNRLQASVNYSDGTLFNLSVRLLAADTEEVLVTETFLNVSVDPSNRRRVDEVLEEESDLVRVTTDLDGSSAPTAAPAVTSAWVQATGGVDDPVTDPAPYEGEEGKKTGIYALENADIFNLLCIPPISPEEDLDSALWEAAAQYCKKRRAVLIVDAPSSWKDANEAALGMATFPSSVEPRDYAAIYYPNVRAADPLKENRLRDFPPCGMVAGIIARTDTSRGLWKAPAGQEAGLRGARELSVKLTDEENGQLNPLGLNCLRSFPVYGNLVWGARTAAGADQLASEWKYLPVRRLALYIEESLYRATQWVVFEPNDEPLWAQIRLNVGAFMHDLFRQGAFQGQSPKEAYFVKCSSETTTQSDINKGIVNILVGFAPLKPAEFVIISIQQIAGNIDT